MHRMLRVFRSLYVLLALALPAPAPAGVPSGQNSTTPACISLVGSTAGVPASAIGSFTVIVRDFGNNPWPGASVSIDISNAFDLFICADQLDPAAIVNCGAKSVRKFTAADGSAHFTVLGGSNGAGTSHTLVNNGRIFANGVLIGAPTVSAYDLDGSNGLGANDLSAWLGDFASGQNYGRSDYDCSGRIGANDLSLWLDAFGSSAMSESCASQCP